MRRSGFGTANAPASSQTRCHFGSIGFASYGSISPPKNKKDLSRERPWGSCRGAAAFASCATREAAPLESTLPSNRDGGNMASYTHLNLKEVEDQAPKFDMSPDLEFRSARVPLEMENAG